MSSDEIHTGSSSEQTLENKLKDVPRVELEDEDQESKSQKNPEQYSPDEAIEALGFGPFQWKILIVSGICWAADACEALLSSLVFLGMLIGAPLFGQFADRYGRRLGYLLSAVITFSFGIISALSPNFTFLLFARFFVGIGVAGGHVAFTLFTEFLPDKTRGKMLLCLEFFWAFGSMGEALLAWLVLGKLNLGWRWFLVFSAIPILLIILIYPWVPESVRFLTVKGKNGEAKDILENAAKLNKRELPQGELVVIAEEGESITGSFKQLFHPSLKKTSLLLSFIWFVQAFAYYGFLLLITIIFQKEGENNGNTSGECYTLSSTEYLDVFYTSTAEFPGIILVLLLIDFLGRKKTQASTLWVTAGIILLLIFFLYIDASQIVLTIILFMIRGLLAGSWQATWVYTPEVYPTTVRSSALGIFSSISRLGGIATPPVATILLSFSRTLALFVYAGFNFSAGALAWWLPKETMGRGLSDIAEDEVEMEEIVEDY